MNLVRERNWQLSKGLGILRRNETLDISVNTFLDFSSYVGYVAYAMKRIKTLACVIYINASLYNHPVTKLNTMLFDLEMFI